MVEFCTHCGISLPEGDLSIEAGREFTSADYVCPSCKKVANPDGSGDADPLDVDKDDLDVEIRSGNVTANEE